MRLAVVDSSVAVKWVVEEQGSTQARKLAEQMMIAPDLLLIECANVLWRKVTIGELSKQGAAARLGRLRSAPIQIEPSANLLPVAFELALQMGHPVYDCLYLALALQEKIPFITADEKLARLVRKHPRPDLQVEIL